jgi:type IV pilus assembly protein PilC
MRRGADEQSDLEFVSRQVGGLIAREGLDFAAALDRVAADAPPALRSSIATLREVAAGQVPSGKCSIAAFAELLQAVRQLGGQIETAVVVFVANATVAYDATADVVRALRASVSYALTLLVVLCIIGTTLETFVLPSLATLYDGYGTQLPALTRILLARSSPLILVVLIGLVVAIAVAWFAWQFGRAARQLLPLPRVLRTLPLAGKVARRLDALLYLVYTSTLLAGGVPPESARTRADSLLDPVLPRELPRPLAGYLDVAQRLTLLPDEVQSQLKTQARDLAEAADRFGRTVDLALRLAVYLAIAGFVIAMYLPLFTLGSVV